MNGGGGGPEAARPVHELGYAEASAELDEIVAFFEQRDIDVDQLVTRLERATSIVDELDRRLRRTRLQVDELVPRLAAAANAADEAMDEVVMSDVSTETAIEVETAGAMEDDGEEFEEFEDTFVDDPYDGEDTEEPAERDEPGGRGAAGSDDALF